MSSALDVGAAAVLGVALAVASEGVFDGCAPVFAPGAEPLDPGAALACAPVAVRGFAEAVLAAGLRASELPPEPPPVPLPVPVLVFFVLRLATVRTPSSNP